MFKKNKCPKCGKKTSENYGFCPHCGNNLKKSNQDWGMLGENDVEEEQNQMGNSVFGGISGNMIGKMLNSAIKMMQKEMQKEMEHQNIKPKTNIRLMINGKEIKINEVPKKQSQNKKEKKVSPLPQKTLKNFTKLPREEPKTNIRRLSDKVTYEIEMPGVKTKEDISIIQLENSIEIKAVSKEKAYHKLIPIGLPITSYNLSKGKLVLEMEAKN